MQQPLLWGLTLQDILTLLDRFGTCVFLFAILVLLELHVRRKGE